MELEPWVFTSGYNQQLGKYPDVKAETIDPDTAILVPDSTKDWWNLLTQNNLHRVKNKVGFKLYNPNPDLKGNPIYDNLQELSYIGITTKDDSIFIEIRFENQILYAETDLAIHSDSFDETLVQTEVPDDLTIYSQGVEHNEMIQFITDGIFIPCFDKGDFKEQAKDFYDELSLFITEYLKGTDMAIEAYIKQTLERGLQKFDIKRKTISIIIENNKINVTIANQ